MRRREAWGLWCKAKNTFTEKYGNAGRKGYYGKPFSFVGKEDCDEHADNGRQHKVCRGEDGRNGHG
ncbi:MAG: hypothetical protein J6M66_07300, partial [Lachnospiraceae bacterium]|nr:hypothetical protein [Lachnospiraceae bacterium]